ncbi:endonuclease/exonuclease/phosphatase family protein [Salininema proteolyticum]|uniref:Endonuclease/exonuclease/phosphatase family protein n=1 Tax=Salininema proteolyticum TaxID=1607685 RepID=A0ABV8U186_9ACTN
MPLSRRHLLAAGTALGATALAPAALADRATAREADGRYPVLIGPPTGPRLHIMSYNIRLDADAPPRSWDNRRPLVRTLLQGEQPSVLCTQEGFFYMLQDLKADHQAYDWIHLGREGGSAGEATCVLYDRRRLSVLAYDHLWLSDTPRLIGSKNWGNDVVRMLTWVRFRDLLTDKEFYVVNNHFDHRSEPSRQKGASLNLEVASDFDAPVVVAGDFNTEPGGESHRILTEGGLVDSWDAAEERLTEEYGTFNGWDPEPRPAPESRRIDWILGEPGIRYHAAAVNTYSAPGGRNPSDHWPVQALISLP